MIKSPFKPRLVKHKKPSSGSRFYKNQLIKSNRKRHSIINIMRECVFYPKIMAYDNNEKTYKNNESTTSCTVSIKEISF
jgi:hypothetical protein